MGLNVSKGNMYDFVTHTWNTVKGACPHDCSYCYMKRFNNQKPVRFDVKELKTDLGKGNFIFVGSSCDMFADGIPYYWKVETLKKCIISDKNKYLFQTKNPGGLLPYAQDLLPINSIICTTIETNRWYQDIMKSCPSPLVRMQGMTQINIAKYVTIEPIMDFDLGPMVELIKRCNPEQVNIGADSGNNHLPEPSIEKIMELVEAVSSFTTVAKKRNIERIIGGKNV